jgi:uncharacterized membrane protein
MAEHASRIGIDRPAGEVFAFLSDIGHMPDYLPTVHEASPQGESHEGEGRVVVAGEANGRPYRSDGWLRLDRAAGRMEWGSDGENDYRGEMRVTPRGDRACEVEVHLHLTPRPMLERQLTAQTGNAEYSVQEGVEAALASIKALCEGTGGKRATSAEGPRRGADEPTGAVEPRSGGRQAHPDDDRLLRDSRPFGRSGTMNPDTT